MRRGSVNAASRTRSLENDVDHLFRKLTISEIAQLEAQKRSELDQENIALRAAVGDKYLDLFKISELSQKLVLITSDIDNSFNTMQDQLQSLRDKSYRKSRENMISNPDNFREKEFLAVVCQVKLILECHEGIWRSVEKGFYLNSARIYLLANVIFGNLRNQKLEQKSALSLFPLVNKQFEVIRELKRDILLKADQFIMTSSVVDSQAVFEFLLCRSLILESQGLDLASFLEGRSACMRSKMINGVKPEFSADYTRSKHVSLQFCDLFDILWSTLKAIPELFDTPTMPKSSHQTHRSNHNSISDNDPNSPLLCASTPNSTLLEELLAKLKSGISITQHVESLSENLKLVINPLFASKVNLSLLFSFLPANVKNPTFPDKFLISFDAPMIKSEFATFCSRWLEQSKRLIRDQMSVILGDVATLDELCSIRSNFLKHLNSRIGGKMIYYENITKFLAMSKSFNLYTDIFKGIFQDIFIKVLERNVGDLLLKQADSFSRILTSDGLNESKGIPATLTKSLKQVSDTMGGVLKSLQKFTLFLPGAEEDNWIISGKDRTSLLEAFESIISTKIGIFLNSLREGVFQTLKAKLKSDPNYHSNILITAKCLRSLAEQVSLLEKGICDIMKDSKSGNANNNANNFGLFGKCRDSLFLLYRESIMIWLKYKVESVFHFDSMTKLVDVAILTYNWEEGTEDQFKVPTDLFPFLSSGLYDFCQGLSVSLNYGLEQEVINEVILFIFHHVFDGYLEILSGIGEESSEGEKFALQFFYDLIFFSKVLITSCGIDVQNSSQTKYKTYYEQIRSRMDPIDVISMDNCVYSLIEKYVNKCYGLYGLLFSQRPGVFVAGGSERRKSIPGVPSEKGISFFPVARGNVRFVHLPTGQYPSLNLPNMATKERAETVKKDEPGKSKIDVENSKPQNTKTSTNTTSNAYFSSFSGWIK